MEGSPLTGSTSGESPISSQAASAGSLIAAVLALVALLDAGVETLWSGSPWRWWIGVPAIAFVALSVWLWRPRGRAAKRWGWPGAASWSIGGLLLLPAVSAWLPEGQINGVRMLLQPTATVLTVMTGAAVILAAFVLIRALAVLPATPRLVARGVLIALAAYALAAIGLAVHDRAPYASLFQGGAAWQRLPRWLQGTFIGALGLIPLAILGQVARLVDRLRRKQPLRPLWYQATALVMSLVMAVSGVIVPERTPQATRAPRPSSAAATRSYADLDESRRALLRLVSGSPDASAAGITSSLKAVDSMLAALQAAATSIPRETFDPNAIVAQVGREPAVLFQWVRDSTSWVPYRGVLRGPTGVLMDRMGNSLDRALLLVQLLEVAGRRARLAHATLTPEQASAFVAQTRAVLPVRSSDSEQASLRATNEMVTSFAKRFGLDTATLTTRLEQQQAASRAIIDRAREEAERQTGALLAAVGRHNRVGIQREAIASDHWWAQVQQDGAWIDLDPGVANGQPGAAFCAAQETLSPGSLPASLRHEVEVRVVVEQAIGGQFVERVALARTLRPSDLFGQPVVLMHIPSGAKPEDLAVQKREGVGRFLTQVAGREDTWVPMLQVGSQVISGTAIGTDGSLVESSPEEASPQDMSGAGSAMGGLGGLLGGGGGETPKPEPQAAPKPARVEGAELTAEWLEYEIRVPGSPATTIRREVFDLAGAAARTRHSTVLPTESQRAGRGLALMTRTDILVLPCRLSPEFVTWLKVKSVLDGRAILTAMLRDRRTLSGADIGRRLKDVPIVPGPLYDLALARHALNPQRDDVYVATPNVLTFHNGFSSKAPGTLMAFRAMDIVKNDVVAHASRVRDLFEASLRQGVYDTNAEAFVQTGSCCGEAMAGTAAAFAAAGTAGTRWRALQRRADLDGLRLPAEATSRLGGDLDAGFVVVAPEAAATTDVSWWRVDPATGGTLGVGSTGWGQAMTEESINHWLHTHPAYAIVFKMYVALFCLWASSVSETAQKVAFEGGEWSDGAVVGIACCVFGFAAGAAGVALGIGALGWMGIMIDILGMMIEKLEELMEEHEGLGEEKATREGIK